eukprot:5818843-Amphidinium_carterae.1
MPGKLCSRQPSGAHARASRPDETAAKNARTMTGLWAAPSLNARPASSKLPALSGWYCLDSVL